MGANFSAIGQQPMSVGMSEDVYNRLHKKHTSETKSAASEKPCGSSEPGMKHVIDNPNSKTPLLVHAQGTPDTSHRLRDLYLKTDRRQSADYGSGRRKYSEYWEQTANEERAVRESIDRVLETEKQRGYAEFEELLPPLPKTDKAKRKMCSENLREVSQCYQANPSRPLLCAGKANDFLNCFKLRTDSSGW